MHRDIDNILDWSVLLIGHLGHAAAYEVNLIMPDLNLIVRDHDRPPTGGRRGRRSKIWISKIGRVKGIPNCVLDHGSFGSTAELI